MRTVLCIALVLLSVTGWAYDNYAIVGGGVLAQDDSHPITVAFVGLDAPVLTDTAKGWVVANRTGYFYADRGGETDIQSLISQVINAKRLGVWGLYAAIKTGVLYEIKSSSDDLMMQVGVEIGGAPIKALGLAVGVDYAPIRGEPDQVTIYTLLNLDPYH